MPDDFDPTEEEWEGGPLEEAPRDEPAPEMPEPEDLAAQLANLEENEGFDEPEIADAGISPIPQQEPPATEIPQNDPLQVELQTLEANEPFLKPSAHAPEVPDRMVIDTPATPSTGDSMVVPGDEGLPAPPATLQGFYEAGGKIQGGLGALPGFPPMQQDGPMDHLKQYLDSSYSMSQLSSELLIDHTAQLDLLQESLERSRL